jgi:hypothetical protein
MNQKSLTLTYSSNGIMKKINKKTKTTLLKKNNHKTFGNETNKKRVFIPEIIVKRKKKRSKSLKNKINFSEKK